MFKVKSKNIFKYAAVVGLLIFFHFIGILSPFENFIVKISSPFTNNFFILGSRVRTTYDEQLDKRDLNLLIEKLKEEKEALLIEKARLNTLEEENEYLRQHLRFSVQNEYRYLMGDVISRNDLMNNSLDERTITINKGRNDGVEDGFVILDSQGVIVGKIIETKDNISKACLTVDKKCKFAVSVQNGDKTNGVTEGDLGLTIKMDFIPQTEEVSKGDLIISSGLEDNIPRGLVIGSVIDVSRENNDLWQLAVVEPATDFDNIFITAILLPN